MRDATAPRRLDRLQTWMLSVELGVWSGIDRKDREVSDDDVLERLLEVSLARTPEPCRSRSRSRS